MQPPSDSQRAALKALWQGGMGVVAQYFMECRDHARDSMEMTDGKARDEATGEAKTLKRIFEIMKDTGGARPIVQAGTTMTN